MSRIVPGLALGVDGSKHHNVGAAGLQYTERTFDIEPHIYNVRAAVGALIGPHGATVDALRRRTGCHIHVMSPEHVQENRAILSGDAQSATSSAGRLGATTAAATTPAAAASLPANATAGRSSAVLSPARTLPASAPAPGHTATTAASSAAVHVTGEALSVANCVAELKQLLAPFLLRRQHSLSPPPHPHYHQYQAYRSYAPAPAPRLTQQPAAPTIRSPPAPSVSSPRPPSPRSPAPAPVTQANNQRNPLLPPPATSTSQQPRPPPGGQNSDTSVADTTSSPSSAGDSLGISRQLELTAADYFLSSVAGYLGRGNAAATQVFARYGCRGTVQRFETRFVVSLQGPTDADLDAAASNLVLLIAGARRCPYITWADRGDAIHVIPDPEFCDFDTLNAALQPRWARLADTCRPCYISIQRPSSTRPASVVVEGGRSWKAKEQAAWCLERHILRHISKADRSVAGRDRKPAKAAARAAATFPVNLFDMQDMEPSPGPVRPRSRSPARQPAPAQADTPDTQSPVNLFACGASDTPQKAPPSPIDLVSETTATQPPSLLLHILHTVGPLVTASDVDRLIDALRRQYPGCDFQPLRTMYSTSTAPTDAQVLQCVDSCLQAPVDLTGPADDHLPAMPSSTANAVTPLVSAKPPSPPQPSLQPTIDLTGEGDGPECTRWTFFVPSDDETAPSASAAAAAAAADAAEAQAAKRPRFKPRAPVARSGAKGARAAIDALEAELAAAGPPAPAPKRRRTASNNAPSAATSAGAAATASNGSPEGIPGPPPLTYQSSGGSTMSGADMCDCVEPQLCRVCRFCLAHHAPPCEKCWCAVCGCLPVVHDGVKTVAEMMQRAQELRKRAQEQLLMKARLEMLESMGMSVNAGTWWDKDQALPGLAPFHWLNKSPWAVLGLPTNASPKDIKARYRALALLLHPDKNPSTLAQTVFIAVNAAYKTLSG